jgi:hypothetical protein
VLGGALALILRLVFGCSQNGAVQPKPSAGPRYWSHSPAVCAVDEVREFYCDALVPLTSALPAPEPYSSCPGSIESHTGLHEPLPPIAVFDSDYTAHTRKRMPPGHSCCYSWCSAVRLADAETASRSAGCDRAPVFRERYCVQEPEAGTSRPAGKGFDRCPAALVPPSGAAFEVPRAAPFDYRASVDRRSQGFQECCYTWCSKVPAATGLEQRGL